MIRSSSTGDSPFVFGLISRRIHAAIKLTVPDRQTLISKLLNDRSSDEIDALSIDIVQSCDKIERITQELFASHHLTKLP